MLRTIVFFAVLFWAILFPEQAAAALRHAQGVLHECWAQYVGAS